MPKNRCGRNRPKTPHEVQLQVAARQEWKCNECKATLPSSFEIDHVIPLHLDGAHDASNMVALCRNCHGAKSQQERIESLNWTETPRWQHEASVIRDAAASRRAHGKDTPEPGPLCSSPPREEEEAASVSSYFRQWVYEPSKGPALLLRKQRVQN